MPHLPGRLTYSETRRHELRKRRFVMVDGNLTLNSQTVDAAASARTYRDGYWGFAAASDSDSAAVERIMRKAEQNAQTMARFGTRQSLSLPEGSYCGEHVFKGQPAIGQNECVNRLAELHAWCKWRYPRLRSTRFMLSDEHHSKWLSHSNGAKVLNSIQRAECWIFFVMEDANGVPVELMESVTSKGSVADLNISPQALAPLFDGLYEHLQAKREGVAARGGHHTIVLASALAGILAHEAMGHPCEADLVLGGAVTRDLTGQRVASDLITLVDVANTFGGQETMVPVYADDEGTPARDAVLIKNGLLTEFMHNRETAARMGGQLTGNARAYAPSDEPLIRMRNTAILPGKDKLGDMIAGVDEGYFLMKCFNGQADSTTEFMFGITLGYEIKGGRLGTAIRDTTLSGSAIKVLKSADAVSDEMYWSALGYCGKKQPMVVSMGGPALRVKAHLGGQ
jgi:TldD protein